MDDVASWIGADLPGNLLVLTVDGGGERWTLDGAPLHAGRAVEVLLEAERRPCGCREDDCARCGGRGFLFRPLWLRAQFEFRNDGDGSGPAFLYLDLVGARRQPRHAIELHADDGVRCRWPSR